MTKEIILNDFIPYFESITTEKGGIPWMFRPKSTYPCEKQETIKSDLIELIKRQKEDGRWDTWYGISEGTKLEWAGTQSL